MLNSVYELDLLEIRLNTLADVVDEFILLEGDHTHAGRPKEIVFREHRDRFSQFHISDFVVELNPYCNAWTRENDQRRALKACAEPFSKDDRVIVSDLDEIPRPELIEELTTGDWRLVEDLYYYYLNTRVGQRWWKGTYVISGSTADAVDFHFTRLDSWLPEIKDAGWHFSSCLGEEGLRHKLLNFAHTEYSSEEAIKSALERYHNLQDLGGSQLSVVDIDATYPKYIQENYHKYRNLIYERACVV